MLRRLRGILKENRRQISDRFDNWAFEQRQWYSLGKHDYERIIQSCILRLQLWPRNRNALYMLAVAYLYVHKPHECYEALCQLLKFHSIQADQEEWLVHNLIEKALSHPRYCPYVPQWVENLVDDIDDADVRTTALKHRCTALQRLGRHEELAEACFDLWQRGVRDEFVRQMARIAETELPQ